MKVERAISPSMLDAIGRDLLAHGESLWYIENGGGTLTRIQNHSISGTHDEDTWMYRFSLPSPGSIAGNVMSADMIAPSTDILHFRINTSSSQPWRGRSPLAIGPRAVANALFTYLNRELNLNNRQAFIGPKTIQKASHDDHEIEKSPESLGLGNRLISFQGDPSQFKRLKFGPELAQSIVNLINELEVSIISAAGIPPNLVLGGEAGTATREDLRRLYAITIEPEVAKVEYELQKKINSGIELDAGVQAREADAASKARAIMQRAQASSTLSKLGIDTLDALDLAGFENLENITIEEPQPPVMQPVMEEPNGQGQEHSA